MKNLFLVLCLSCLSLPSFAQTDPCQKDRDTLCKAESEKHGNIVECLQAHKDKLSKACRDHDALMSKVIAEMKPSCFADYQKICTKNEQSLDEIKKCMKAHKKDLSEACRKDSSF